MIEVVGIKGRLGVPVAGVPAWTIAVLGIAAIALVPWSIALGATLPEHHVVRHWDLAWAGFDVGLALLLLSTVIAAFRGSRWLSSLALASAAMLLCDAWFDVLTAGTRAETWLAISGAVLVEAPLAALCVTVSMRSLPGNGGTSASRRP
jgi:hypothetical protein